MTHELVIQSPPAHVTLWAHRPAPARVELVQRPIRGRVVRTVLSLLICWGAIPFVLWVPPHYPWVISAFALGAFLAHRNWTGRYQIQSFAGICPRCGSGLSLGVDRTVNLPLTLTCFSCHFEPRLEVEIGSSKAGVPEAQPLVHQRPDCIGKWRIVWLADEPFLLCDACHGGGPASAEARKAADAENEAGDLLGQLADEGRPLI